MYSEIDTEVPRGKSCTIESMNEVHAYLEGKRPKQGLGWNDDIYPTQQTAIQNVCTQHTKPKNQTDACFSK